MKIIVTGSNGQLGSEFRNLKSKDLNWNFLSSKELDITNKKSVFDFFQSNKTDLIFNCAAYTNVDEAENNVKQSYLVNETGVGNLVEICYLLGIKLVHFSTDYVFDGKHKTPYREVDATNPPNIYGKSKRAGENKILQSNIYSLIIRTSWLYSNYGNNFVKKMLEISEFEDEITLVSDQFGRPTSASDLVNSSIEMIQSDKYEWKKGGEIFHYSNEEDCSWYEFANEIFKIKNIQINTLPVSSKKFQTIATRPKYSLLNLSKIKSVFDINISNWKVSLKTMLK